MSQTADCRHQSLKWMREPSSDTRIVVIVSGLDSDHIDLMHHGFSCFDNIALMHVDTANAGSDKRVEGLIDAVDQVKSLARTSPPPPLEALPELCRSCP